MSAIRTDRSRSATGRIFGVFLSMAVLAVVLMPVSAIAQDTTSAIRGRVIDANGQLVAGATIDVLDTRTGVHRNISTGANGVFLASRLPVGGPYTVTVNSNKTVEIPSISLGDTYSLTVNLLEEAEIEEVITIGRTQDLVDTTSGPAATFTLVDLESAVAFNRDIKDAYAIDPRLNLDGFQVNCAGRHPRFNSVSLDGVSQNDRFGLNTNGYSTATGMPFPYDGIQQVSVELAPFDVTYGGFSACNINAVTKSGSNEWEFSLFYEFTNEDYKNDELEGSNVSQIPYEETKQGFSFGGPIIKDKLFIFAAYEESEEPRTLAIGHAGSGNGVERSWLSKVDYDRIVDIATNKYKYDPGGMPMDGAQTDEKYMARVDWNINDDHNLALIYNYYDGIQSRESDGFVNATDEFEFANHGYNKGAESETTTVKLESQWTDVFSTELFYSENTMIDSQVTVGPKDFGDHQIDFGNNGVFLGADDSRQANGLDTASNFAKISGQLLAGDHVITAGYEREELSIFNIFVQHSRGGEWDYYGLEDRNDDGVPSPAYCAGLDAQGRFDDLACDVSGLDQFDLGRPSNVFYGSGGGTNNPLDAAASFTNTLHALYAQDEVYIDHLGLTIVAGLRYETFTSSDTPRYNATFSEAHGIRNDTGIDGLDLLMPRFGFTWDMRDDLSLRGGVGLYGGGNPNVWISNAWSNDGITAVQEEEDYDGSASVFDGGIPLIGGARPGYDTPQLLFDRIAAVSGDFGSDSRLVIIDPNYKQPREWKMALGATWDLPWWDLRAEIDYMHTRQSVAAQYVDVSQGIVGTTTTGTPIYENLPGLGDRNFMLTNTSDHGSSNVFSILVDKSFDWGLDVRAGYAYTEANDVNPMVSFTSESSFVGLNTNNVNSPVSGPSNYVVPHRFTLRASFAREFFGDNTTRVTAMFYHADGQPQSYAMDANGGLENNSRNARALLYVPTGPTDPNVVFNGATFETDAFFDWVKAEGLSPGYVQRNATHAKASGRMDLRIDQEIPLFHPELKARLFVKVYNFSNMLNKDWGRAYDSKFNAPIIVNGGVDSSGRYLFNTFESDPDDRSVTELFTNSSLWEARIGIEVNFR